MMNATKSISTSDFAFGARAGRSVRIVIVEDDLALAGAIEATLQIDAYTIETIGSSEQVLSNMPAQCDLMIVDVGLPGMDGFELVSRLRAGGHRMPIMMLTARDAVEDRVRGFELGADDYVAKPFALPELRARVQALLRRAGNAPGSRIVHGPLTLDMSARRAFLNDRPLDLAAREWAVLEVLLARVEKVVSKETIIQAVAGWDEELSANAIEVYVSRLRSKLAGAGIQIRTVRGFGYMIEEFRALSAS